MAKQDSQEAAMEIIDSSQYEENVVQLISPIKAHGKVMHKLSFREPEGGDIISCGMPMYFEQSLDGGSNKMKMDAKAVGALISELAGIPLSSVKKLKIKDYVACSNMVMGFFEGMDEPT